MDTNNATAPPAPPAPGDTPPRPRANPAVVRQRLAYAAVGLLIFSALTGAGCYIAASPYLHALAADNRAFQSSSAPSVEQWLELSPEQRKTLREQEEYYMKMAIWLGIAAWHLLLAGWATYQKWLHRSYRNLHDLHAEQIRFTPRGADLWHLVPVVNLWKIPQIWNDLWLGSDPLGRHRSTPLIPLCMTVCSLAAAALIALWIIGFFLTNFLLFQDSRPLIIAMSAHGLLHVAAVACLCIFILKITHFQEIKQQRL